MTTRCFRLALVPLALYVAPCLALASSPGRIDLGEALESMTAQACERVFSSDAAESSRCKQEHFDPRSRDNHYLWEQGDAGDRDCLMAGGVLVNKMPHCVDAMATLLEVAQHDDPPSMLHALGDYVKSCAAQELCISALSAL